MNTYNLKLFFIVVGDVKIYYPFNNKKSQFDDEFILERYLFR